MDRIRATRLAVQCMDWIQQACSMCDSKTLNRKIYTTHAEHACVIGIRGGEICFTPVTGLTYEWILDREEAMLLGG
jgi:hypothetical protein